MHGSHNVQNALAVIAICHYENIPMETIATYLRNYEGVKRRFNEKTFQEQILIDDYAHHPTEVTATIEAARQKYPNREIVAVFQPHTYTRTKTFLNEFAESLSEADAVYLCDIFGSAREERGNLSIQDLQNKVPKSQLIDEETIGKLSQHRDAVLIFMGAGDIQKYQNSYEKSVM